MEPHQLSYAKLAQKVIEIRSGLWIALIFATILTGCIGPDTGVEDWRCLVTQDDPRVDKAGGGAVFEGGDCAVLHAGCRRQAECELLEKEGETNSWYLIGLDLQDPEIQERLR